MHPRIILDDEGFFVYTISTRIFNAQSTSSPYVVEIVDHSFIEICIGIRKSGSSGQYIFSTSQYGSSDSVSRKEASVHKELILEGGCSCGTIGCIRVFGTISTDESSISIDYGVDFRNTWSDIHISFSRIVGIRIVSILHHDDSEFFIGCVQVSVYDNISILYHQRFVALISRNHYVAYYIFYPIYHLSVLHIRGIGVGILPYFGPHIRSGYIGDIRFLSGKFGFSSSLDTSDNPYSEELTSRCLDRSRVIPGILFG